MKRLLILAALLAVLICQLESFTCPQPVVNMNHNQRLCGKRYDVQVDNKTVTVEKFLGVPFAKPPIGNLRFSKPQPNEPWRNQERLAYEYSPSCLQYTPSDNDKRIKGLLMWFPKNQSEDCLYLNIYRPKYPFSDDSKLPVMVWIYGGSFNSGTGSLDVYNGEILAASQDVIVVTMNYRVGILGFLYADGSDTDPDYNLVGNQGLWDQNLALKWVKENIENFGGDKDKITLFGESAGSVSVSLQYMSPFSSHLFNRMMLQSGSAYGRWVLDDKKTAQEKTDLLLIKLNCPDIKENRHEAMNCLRRARSEEFLQPEMFAEVRIRNRKALIQNNLNLCVDCDASRMPNLYFDCFTNPVIEGVFIPKSPEEFFRTSSPKKDVRDYIVGTNRNEGMFFILYYFQIIYNDQIEKPTVPETIEKIREMLVYDFLPEFTFHNDLSKLVMQRYKLDQQDMSQDDFLQRLDALGSHLDFTCPTLLFGNQILYKMEPENIFVYLFDIRTEGLDLPPWIGVMHGYEIEYIFGVPFQKKFQEDFFKFTKIETAVSRKIMEFIGNFARTGYKEGIPFKR